MMQNHLIKVQHPFDRRSHAKSGDVVVNERIVSATRHPKHIEAAAIVVYMYCTALLPWITHTHLVSLSVTKRRPVHFILNPGHVEYELDVLMV